MKDYCPVDVVTPTKRRTAAVPLSIAQDFI